MTKYESEEFTQLGIFIGIFCIFSKDSNESFYKMCEKLKKSDMLNLLREMIFFRILLLMR